jgi:hypothetical protein
VSAFVGAIAIFPGCPSEWKRSASSSVTRMAAVSVEDKAFPRFVSRRKRPFGAASYG